MEDTLAHVHMDSSGYEFFGVFDGHGGTVASEWCEAHFHQILDRLLQNKTRPTLEILNDAFAEADRQLFEENKIYFGTTAAVALYKPKHTASKQGNLYCANVGDTRIVMNRLGKAIRLSRDHVPSDREERKRIGLAGGFIANGRVNGILGVTRAIGDGYIKDLVIGKPDTTKIEVTSAVESVIIACDGLWDVCSDQKAVDIARHKNPQRASEELVDHALHNYSTDNITVMVIRF